VSQHIDKKRKNGVIFLIDHIGEKIMPGEYGGKPNWDSARKGMRGGDPTPQFSPSGKKFQQKLNWVKRIVIERKQGTVASLAQATGLQLRDIYGCLEVLVAQNLVTRDDTGNWKLLPSQE
jgi:hypothetical protein